MDGQTDRRTDGQTSHPTTIGSFLEKNKKILKTEIRTLHPILPPYNIKVIDVMSFYLTMLYHVCRI